MNPEAQEPDNLTTFLAHAHLSQESGVTNVICKSNGDVYHINNYEYRLLSSLLILANPQSEMFAIFYPMIDVDECK